MNVIHIRWMIEKDLEQVLKIENECFPYPWTRDDFITAKRAGNVEAVVCEYRKSVIGYMISYRFKDCWTTTSIAVTSEHRRRGVATSMLDRMKGKLSQERRRYLVADIADYNLDAQLFFRENGFRFHTIVRDHFIKPRSDSYQLVFQHIPSVHEIATLSDQAVVKRVNVKK